MIENLLQQYQELLKDIGLSDKSAIMLENLTVLLVIFLLAFLADRVTKKILVVVIQTAVKKTKTEFDDILFKKKVFSRLAHVAPALVINATVIYFVDIEGLANFIRLLTNLYIIFVTALVVDALLGALHEIYLQLPISRGRNIKGYLQLLRIMAYIIAALVAISVLTEKEIGNLLAGLGAFAAVLMLVFKDTILGLVASIQIAGNDMVTVGDWISMPDHGADGDVIDISLNTVKVQNWDKTISTIPTYALVSESFTNWRGMEKSGGRRIKRSINIDMKSIKFVDKTMLEKYRRIHVLQDYIDKKEKEIEEYNKKIGADENNLINGRRMTNFGTFRKYLEIYLNNHPMVNKKMTFMIRHLQPTDKGIPLEIYVFSTDIRWPYYEAIQADIFDHILAVVPEFGLRVFQNPTGDDFQKLVKQ
ncbi:MAG TPA: mechanosensitive ion channel domain-containing protein [Bacteroidales bacterium]|nr:mechanosensitive ion channel domain-containing protein [Bacteroidales bacterium]